MNLRARHFSFVRAEWSGRVWWRGKRKGFVNIVLVFEKIACKCKVVSPQAKERRDSVTKRTETTREFECVCFLILDKVCKFLLYVTLLFVVCTCSCSVRTIALGDAISKAEQCADKMNQVEEQAKKLLRDYSKNVQLCGENLRQMELLSKRVSNDLDRVDLTLNSHCCFCLSCLLLRDDYNR